MQETKENKLTSLESLTQWANNVNSKLSTIQTDNDDLQAKVKNLQTSLQTIVSEQQTQQKSQQAQQKQLASLRAQIEASKEAAEISALEKQVQALEAELKNLKTSSYGDTITKQLQALQQEYQTANQGLAQAIKLNSSFRAQLQSVIEQNEQQIKQTSQWQSEFSARETACQEAQATAITELQTQLSQTKTALTKRLAELEKRVSGLETWAAQIRTQLSEVKTDSEDVQAKIKGLNSTLEKVISEQSQQQRQQQQVQKQLSLLRAQIDASSNAQEVQALSLTVENLAKQLQEQQQKPAAMSEITKQLEALHGEYQSAKKGLEQAVKFNSSLRSQLQSVITESERQTQQVEFWQKGFYEQLAEQQKAQEAAVNELQAQLSQIKTALTKRLAALEGRVEKLEIKHDHLATELKSHDPKFTVAQKILKLRAAILEDKFISDELKYFVAPNGEGMQGLGDHQPLHEWVQTNLLDAKAEARVLLLQGVAGAGKSTFNRYLMRQLWQDDAWKNFKPGMPATKVYLPIFIPLGSPQTQPTQLLKYLNDLPELVDDLTEQEINVLKTDYQLLLIADGYDEMPSNQKLNLYDTNQLQQYPGIKLVIGCRTQRAQELNETDVFTPHNTSGQPQYPYFKRRHVSPFNDEQIKDYVTKYLAQNKNRTDVVLWKESQMYVDQLSKLPDLKALLTTPFALLMSIEVLPGIVETAEKAAQKSSESKGGSKNQESKETKISQTTQFTRAKLYDAFMDHWFKRQAEKARQAGDTTNAKELIRFYQKFCFKLAECLRAAGVTAVQYPFGDEALDEDLYSDKPKEAVDPKGPRGPWVKKLLGTENEGMVRARKGAPLTVATGNYYQFIHASFIDYFSTTAILVQAQPTEAVKPEENKTEVQVLQDTVSSSLEVLLGDKPMSRDQLYLLADRLQQEPTLQSQLLRIIERSKQTAQLALAAANAISALNAGGVNLSHQDFRGIRVPGADLSGALLHATQLQGADLTGVNFQGAWLIEAQLQRAHLKGIRFGEEAFVRLKDYVMDCQYSPDGYWFAIAVGKNIELYEAATRRWVRTFSGHTERVCSVSWDCKGERLASGSWDNTARVWEVGSGRELRCLQGHTRYVQSVSWDGKGERLVSGSSDYTVRVWEVGSGCELHCLKGHTSSVTSVSWDGKGERLASGSLDKTVRVWEVGSGRELRCLQGHTGYVQSVSWDPKGERLAWGGDYGVRVWEVESGRELRILRGHTHWVTRVSWDPKGERLASGSWDNTARVWEVGSGRELRCLQGHRGHVQSVSWDPKGERLASGGDYEVRVWEVGSGRELRSHKGHANHVNSVSWDAKGERLASGSNDNTVRMWEVGSGRELHCLKGHIKYVRSVSWDIKGERLASGGDDDMVLVREVGSGLSQYLARHKATVMSISWDGKGERLASGSEDKTVRVWEVGSGRELRCLQGHTDSVTSVSWDGKGERLASGSHDKTVRVWEVGSGRELRSLQGNTDMVLSVAWDGKGERLASGSRDGTVRVWEVDSGRELRSLKVYMSWVTSVFWDDKGERLVSGSSDGTVRVWEVNSGKELFRLSLPEQVWSVALAPSNERGEALLAVAFGRVLGCFELVSKDHTYTSRLKWLAVDGAQLRVSDLNIAGAQGLSAEHVALLQQRGAIGKPADTPSLETKQSKPEARGDSKDESKLSGVKGFAASAAQLGTFASSAASPAKASTTAPVTEFKTTSQRG